MGCTASKLDNEDTVRRCKERRRLMKDAVYARHHLAASHSDYCRSLRLTGSALTVFAAGEPLSVSDQTPAVLLRTPSSHSQASTIPPPPRRVIPSPSPAPSFYHPTPPPPPAFAPSPTVASSKLPHILSAASSRSSTRRIRKQPVKLPHILSESSICSSPKGHNRARSNHFEPNFAYDANQNHNFSTTASQTSSVWNWENFYPPSPPDSDYFQRRHPNDDDKASTYSNYHKHEPHEPHKSQIHHIDVEEEEETEREEVHYSEWDDHYNTTTTSSEEDDDDEGDRDSRSEMGTQSNFGSSVHNEPKAPPPAAAASKYSTMSKSDKSDDAGSSYSWNPTSKHAVDDISDMKMVVRHRDLAEIVAAIKDNFDKAASAGEQVSEMLETSRAQMDRSFSRLKKTVYHSSGVLSSLSSSWTSKPPLAVKYQFEPTSIGESGDSKSLCSSLERLLAWEKKLYEEVKAREGVKIAHEKKLSVLQSQEGRGGDEAKLDKTKASIKRLQSLILVTSQAVATTSSAITGVRDTELVPQLVELCHGFMYMWKSMNQFHEIQNHIVQQVRGLVNRSAKGESTSDLHRQATRDLESAVSAWHSNFCRLIKFQRDFLRSLHGWFKLTLLPVTGEPATGGRETSEAFSFCDEWKLSLDRVPDTVASEAIKSFINVVHSISAKQAEEVKIKKRTESASKELEKKASSLRNIEKKYYHSYSMVGIGLPNTGPDNGSGLDARDPLSEKKMELEASRRRVEDEMQRHSKAVEVTRAMTLNNIQTGLPGVFQAMTMFSSLIVEALETACSRSYAIK